MKTRCGTRRTPRKLKKRLKRLVHWSVRTYNIKTVSVTVDGKEIRRMLRGESFSYEGLEFRYETPGIK